MLKIHNSQCRLIKPDNFFIREYNTSVHAIKLKTSASCRKITKQMSIINCQIKMSLTPSKVSISLQLWYLTTVTLSIFVWPHIESRRRRSSSSRAPFGFVQKADDGLVNAGGRRHGRHRADECSVRHRLRPDLHHKDEPLRLVAPP